MRDLAHQPTAPAQPDRRVRISIVANRSATTDDGGRETIRAMPEAIRTIAHHFDEGDGIQMFDWDAAEETLYASSKEQVARFLRRVDADDIYGMGFFCDPLEGVMLVANGRACLASSNIESLAGDLLGDEETLKWDIGNWEYPAGLSPSAEQQAYDAAWEPFRESLSEMDDDDLQEKLETVCISVLRRLSEEEAFSAARNLEGFIVLGPDDPPDDVLSKKRRLDHLLA